VLSNETEFYKSIIRANICLVKSKSLYLSLKDNSKSGKLLNFNNKQTVMLRVSIFLFREKTTKSRMCKPIQTTNRRIGLSEKTQTYPPVYRL